MTDQSNFTFQTVDALLFDLGGVVIDIDFNRVFRAWGADAGMDPELVAARFSIDRAYQNHERGEITHREYFDALRSSLGISLTDQQFADGWNSIYVGEVQGIHDLLCIVREQRPVYAFTNTNHLHKSAWQTLFADLLKPFEAIFSSMDLRMRKPDKQAFEHVARKIGVPVNRIAFFDDSLENVRGAQDTGMRAFHTRTVEETTAALRTL